MDAGETDREQGAGVETAPARASSSSDDVNDLVVAVGEDGGSGAAPVIEVFLTISMKRRGPRVPRTRRKRAVARPPAAAAGADHGGRRSKEFVQWREWYLRKQRREKEKAWFYDYAGIPPPGSWI